jgi:glycerophosphoryl diester phosphodiesterase
MGDLWERVGEGGAEVPLRPAPPVGLPPVIGHRGASGAAPENTLAAIRIAREHGAAWIEFDVKLSRDRQPIVIHDDRLERTTDGFGPVADTTLAEIRRLSAGRWFDRRFAAERVPTFDEVLALAVELGLGVNVEIKPCAGREAETARVVVEALVRHWPSHMPTPLISSFAHEALTVARQVAPAIPRGYLSSSLPRNWLGELDRYACATLHLGDRRVSRRQIAQVHAAGVPLLLYTVNDSMRARGLIETGVRAVFSDFPREVLAALAQ